MLKKIQFWLLVFLFTLPAFAEKPSLFSSSVKLGVDVFFAEKQNSLLKGKRVGLILNATSYTSSLEESYEIFKREKVKIVALFSPEHGLNGAAYAGEYVEDSTHYGGVPLYSLHGATRRPTEAMLKDIDVLIFDIQEIGSRSYTYATTLFYVMEEAAKRNIEVIVLDRPNPINGMTVDGPLLKPEWRSFLGYINVPYCHGMTIGELAQFFNTEYHVGCKLKVIPMKGWRRWMNFRQTALHWLSTSPNIPEADTPYFYPSTGIIGALGIVNIGIGYTQPFKIVGAPWIQATQFAQQLNEQKIPGVQFLPYYFKPFYGLYKNEECQGVRLVITQPELYRPVKVQYLLLGVLKTLYPEKFTQLLQALPPSKIKTFNYINGTDEVYQILSQEKYAAWKLIKIDEEARAEFMQKRKKYLLY